MPIIKSAKKRVRVATKATVRNAKTKRTLKGALKVFRSKVTAESQRKAQGAIDTAVKKGLMHKNKAARKKRQLAAAAKAAGVKHAGKAVKKAAVKKTASKKPAAKKAAVKKTAKK